jgi:uncharacterized membrane protein
MKPLFVLLGAFILSLLATMFLTGTFDYALAGIIAMSVMLVFTAIGHFAYTKGMRMMIPDFIPFKTGIVYLTGVFEIVAAIFLHVPSIRTITALSLSVFFILMIPANIKAAIHKVDYQKGNYEGNGPTYLWFRIPLQILFIVWVYICAIRF